MRIAQQNTLIFLNFLQEADILQLSCLTNKFFVDLEHWEDIAFFMNNVDRLISLDTFCQYSSVKGHFNHKILMFLCDKFGSKHFQVVRLHFSFRVPSDVDKVLAHLLDEYLSIVDEGVESAGVLIEHIHFS